MLQHDHYAYRVTWSEEDKEHVGLCAEFSSLSWLDQTPEEALKGIRQIVADVVTELESNGEKGLNHWQPRNTAESFRLG